MIRAILLMSALSCPAEAQQRSQPGYGPSCFATSGLSQTLTEGYGEHEVWWGHDDRRGTLLSLWMSPELTWTLVEHYPNGRSCIAASGQWMQAVAPLTGEPA